MAYKWAAGDLWKGKFDYIYRVTLKTLLNEKWKEEYGKSDLRKSLLKCLAHYYLLENDSSQEPLELSDMYWPSQNEKILLLIDGFDEVAHKRTDKDFKRLFEEIFQHDNLILTSRPNAIDKDLEQKFDRKIENTGLDNSGIQQYFK